MKNRERKGILFVLPSVIGVSIFVLLPALYTLWYSFMNSITKRWVGLNNFKRVIENQAFHLALGNTLRFTVVCIPLLIVLSLAISVLLVEYLKNNYLIKSAFLIPLSVPCVSVVFLWNIIFDNQGLLNGLLDKFGKQGLDWMNTKYAFTVLVISYIWKNIGYDIILWWVGLVNIPQDYYDAAKVDGANGWQSFRYITLPNLKETCCLVLILSLINSFKVFREAYLVAGNYPHRSIYLLQHLFNNWFAMLEFEKMAAATILISAVILVTIGSVKIGRKKWGGRS